MYVAFPYFLKLCEGPVNELGPLGAAHTCLPIAKNAPACL